MAQEPILLTRHRFREAVFARDAESCVFCGKPAVNAHHIIERRLWDDLGYYIDNGASVCAIDHLQCEMTLHSVEAARKAAGISRILVPPQFYAEDPIDKWGNYLLPNGLRMRGELFFDASVQKILREGAVLDLFTNRVKYPRTYHVPWSPGMNANDRMMPSIERFLGERVVTLEKMDGEGFTMYSDGNHARSLDGRNHPSRNWAKNFWGTICHDIPPDWRICCENVYAQHSIAYDDLASYLYGISVWNERNECLPWDETLEWFDLFGITPCRVLYDGIFDQKRIQALYDEKRDYDICEGNVTRIADGFSYGQFRHCVGKYVRRAHVQTAPHWMHGRRIIPNKLRSGR